MSLALDATQRSEALGGLWARPPIPLQHPRADGLSFAKTRSGAYAGVVPSEIGGVKTGAWLFEDPA